MRFILPLLATLAVALPAAATDARPRPGQIIPTSCRQGECSWLRVVSVEPGMAGPEGRLIRMTARRGSSTHADGNLPAGPRGARIQWEEADEVGYAFCSTRRPAFGFAPQGEGLIVHFLDLYDLGGYQEASGRLYMRLCHSRGDVPRAAALRRMGYRPGTRNEQIENGTPETMTRF